MQLNSKWKNVCFLLVLCSFLVFVISMIPLVSCDGETSVNVKFEILTGSSTQDYYSGDYFCYNITLQNSGTTMINATFSVTVLNTTGGIIGEIHTYNRNLEPNDTTFLYPNYTRLEKDEVSIYFMDTAGTYTIELSSSLPMYYYRWYGETGRYTVETNVCHMNIDVMPSYQKVQNDLWNQYMNQSENYMKQVQAFNAQSVVEAGSTKVLAKTAVGVTLLSTVFNIIALPKTRREEYKGFIIYCYGAMLVILAIVFFIL